ncbi:hypothetical protein VRRI112168_19745 [Vreelandella rituensis]
MALSSSTALSCAVSWLLLGVFDVPGHGRQPPFAADLVETAQRDLPKSHHVLDDAKDRFHRVLAQRIQRASRPGLQTMRPVREVTLPLTGFHKEGFIYLDNAGQGIAVGTGVLFQKR